MCEHSHLQRLRRSWDEASETCTGAIRSNTCCDTSSPKPCIQWQTGLSHLLSPNWLIPFKCRSVSSRDLPSKSTDDHLPELPGLSSQPFCKSYRRSSEEFIPFPLNTEIWWKHSFSSKWEILYVLLLEEWRSTLQINRQLKRQHCVTLQCLLVASVSSRELHAEGIES